jgi:hypothetical protein
MQSSNKEESKDKMHNEIQSTTQYSNEDLTFAKSPYKKHSRFSNTNKNVSQAIHAKIFKKINDDKYEQKSQQEKFSKFQEINIKENTSNTERIRDELKKDFNEDEGKEKEEIPTIMKARVIAPKSNYVKNQNFDDLNKNNSYEIYDNQNESNSFKKKKKEWKSWSSQEKELFYEAIANGVNYSSLQKLFKNMNNVKFSYYSSYLILENRN